MLIREGENCVSPLPDIRMDISNYRVASLLIREKIERKKMREERREKRGKEREK